MMCEGSCCFVLSFFFVREIWSLDTYRFISVFFVCTNGVVRWACCFFLSPLVCMPPEKYFLSLSLALPLGLTLDPKK